jgi:general L-amino acid transport system permease protein
MATLVATLLLTGLLVASCMRSSGSLAATAVAGGAGGVLCADVRQGHGPEPGRDRPLGRPAAHHLAGLAVPGDGFPIALVVALGRRSNLPAIRSFCTMYVELIRGVPLISVLFMASFMFPLFMPQGTIDVLLRVLVGITLFAAAYMAEVIRGGLQAIPKGQVEAAATLGLSTGRPSARSCCRRRWPWWCPAS